MIWELINRLIGNLGYIILISFIMIKTNIMYKSITNKIRSKREMVIAIFMFSALGIIGTCIGISYNGSIVNIRNVLVVLASIVYGPIVGGISGIICAVHRFLYSDGAITAIPCSIATAVAGIVPGLLYNKCEKKDKYIFGVFSIIAIESISIIIIKVLCNLDETVIASIYIPMIIINSISYCIMICIFNNVLNEKDRIEGNQYMVLGLASLVSTELQIGKIKEYENMANKAEIRALQTQINPHFLFNALNTITSFVRINPDKARELIVNLSQYLRYNLEFKDDFIELKDEINQVNSFVAIEEARFPGKFQIHYEINEEDMHIKIPPLTIEPLVENAIKHGILHKMCGKNVWVKCVAGEKSKKIIIEDDGCGIDEKIIEDIYVDKCNSNKVGLYNVYSRIKLIYGTKLDIERLKHGTRISFEI